MTEIRETYRSVRRILRKAPFTEEDAEARRIIAFVFGRDFSQLVPRFFDVCGEDKKRLAEALARKRLSGVPIAYVLGESYFYERTFAVNESVLIPRFDSECVVQAAIRTAKAIRAQTALDLCCGSGVLGITLAAETRLASVDFADISAAALAVAQKNAKELIPQHNCAFFPGDFSAAVAGRKYDLILCNPPYISEAEYAELDAGVKDYEPKTALLAARDGYEFYIRAALELPAILNANSAAVFEIGEKQEKRVSEILNAAGFFNLCTDADMAGRPRCVTAFWRGTPIKGERE